MVPVDHWWIPRCNFFPPFYSPDVSRFEAKCANEHALATFSSWKNHGRARMNRRDFLRPFHGEELFTAAAARRGRCILYSLYSALISSKRHLILTALSSLLRGPAELEKFLE